MTFTPLKCIQQDLSESGVQLLINFCGYLMVATVFGVVLFGQSLSLSLVIVTAIILLIVTAIVRKVKDNY